jgi:hypothetical protein
MMILNDKSEWNPETADILKWQSLYPAVDVYQELNAMDGWLDANPTKRKTAKGVKRFVNSWLSRAQDKGGSPMAHGKSGIINKTRDMTALDDLTHNFTGDPAMREFFIKKYGQCFEDGVRYT